MKQSNARMSSRWRLSAILLGILLIASSVPLSAKVSLPAIFTDHMVLQRAQSNPVWGWADPGESITVKIASQSHSTVAGSDGRWRVKLDPMPVGPALELVVAGKNTVVVSDVLVGEVWLCSGQSNMQFAVQTTDNADLEIQTANYPKIRLISVPQVGTQERQENFDGAWQVATPASVADFSAVGFYFGRLLHQALDVPIGLIDNSWGGSAAEAWVNLDLLKQDKQYAPLLEKWAETERTYDHGKAEKEYESKLARWQQNVEKARKAGEEIPNRPRAPQNPLAGQHRPANLYNGVLSPIIGYGIKGAIWYQGEANSTRAYQYRHLFPLMIQCWRDEWKQGDFPFYWVQLADFRDEQPEPVESSWAELREAQTMTMKSIPNGGQAVIIDLGESHDIHPKNKQDVAKRLARWPLALQYGLDIPYQSPLYKSMEVMGNRIVVTFDEVGAGLDTFDVRTPKGFAIAGKDRKFVWAEANIIAPDQVEVWADSVPNPVAVRYAWADNPVCNLQSAEGLKATPFRTDNWPGVTADVVK